MAELIAFPFFTGGKNQPLKKRLSVHESLNLRTARNHSDHFMSVVMIKVVSTLKGVYNLYF